MKEYKDFDLKKYLEEKCSLKQIATDGIGLEYTAGFCPHCNGTDFKLYDREYGHRGKYTWNCDCLGTDPKDAEFFKGFKAKEYYDSINFFQVYDKCTWDTAKNRVNALIKEDEKKAPGAQESETFDIKDLDYETFSKYLIDKYKIINLDNSLYIYKQGVYEVIEDKHIDYLVMDNLYNSKITHRREAFCYIRKNAPIKKLTDSRYILFNNCIYDINKKSTQDITDDFVFINKIPFNYNITAVENKEVSDFLNGISCGDGEIKTLIIQVMGYCLFRSNKFSKFFILKGNGGNGKSTLFDFIKYVLGENNVSDLSLDDLSGQFGVGSIRNKLVNLGDDIEDVYLEKVANIKKMVSGNTLTVEEKYQPKQHFKHNGKLIFTANSIPRMSDTTDGMKRRLIIVPLEADFRKAQNNDVDILEKICNKEAAEYMLRIALEALHDLLKNKEFCKCEKADQATADYAKENNPILSFLEDFECDGEPVGKCYTSYRFRIEEDAMRPLSKIMFSKRIKAEGYIVDPVFRNGGTIKIFKKIKV